MCFSIINTRWLTFGMHPRWVLFLWVNEGGIATLQIGPVIAELIFSA